MIKSLIKNALKSIGYRIEKTGSETDLILHSAPFASKAALMSEADFPAASPTASGVIAVQVQMAGGDVKTYSAKFEAGATQEQQGQALATVINDANIGVGVFANEDGSFDIVTALSSGTDAGQIQTFTFGSGIDLAAATAAQTGTVTVAPETTSNKVENIDLSTVLGAQTAVITIDQAIQKIDAQRADLGAVQNRFENTIANLQNIAENVSAARGRIQDTDFAAETAALSKNQIMQQAGTAILAQANQLPQAVLSLLQ